jgi:hypothetical protein
MELSPQFQYDTMDVGERRPLHRIQAFAGPTYAHVGTMLWDSKHIRNINTNPGFERRGVATSMWNEGQRLASESGVPAPKHSPDRTAAGDAWARSVGGRLPRRKS